MIGKDRKGTGKKGGTCRLSILLLTILAGTTACHRSTAERRQRYFEAGNRYFEQKKFAEAESEYNRTIQADPGFAEGYYRLGLAQLQEEHWTPAARSLARAIELAPDNLDARLRLGDLLVASTQYSEAAEQAEEVLRHDAQNARAHALLGQVYLHGNNTLPPGANSSRR